MSRGVWRTVGLVGGVLGAAAATGAAVGVAAKRSKIADERQQGAAAHPPGLAPLGLSPPGRPSSVTADDGIRLAAEEVDPLDGRPASLTVVLVHGFALDSRCWHFQRLALAELTSPRVRTVLYDQRSHGHSENAPRESCTITQLGSDLDAVIRALAPQGLIVLVGHSMGGMAIMALAEDHPELFVERVAGVALISTSAGEVASSGLPSALLSHRNPLIRGVGALARWQPGLVEQVRRVGSDFTWAAVRACSFGDPTNVDPALVDLVDSMIAANGVDALVDFVGTLGTHDRRAALPALAICEVLIASGESDRMIPFEHSEAIAAELPDAVLMRLQDTGHMAMLERPDAVDAAVVQLVERCAQRGRRGLGRLRRRA